MHKTVLTNCLCGASNCRKFLGLIRDDMSFQIKSKTERSKCSVCRKSSLVRRDKFVVCNGCSKGFHLKCLKPVLPIAPVGWSCQKCEKK